MVAPFALYCIASHDTFTSSDNILLKQCDASEVLKRKQFFYLHAEHTQNAPS